MTMILNPAWNFGAANRGELDPSITQYIEAPSTPSTPAPQAPGVSIWQPQPTPQQSVPQPVPIFQSPFQPYFNSLQPAQPAPQIPQQGAPKMTTIQDSAAQTLTPDWQASVNALKAAGGSGFMGGTTVPNAQTRQILNLPAPNWSTLPGGYSNTNYPGMPQPAQQARPQMPQGGKFPAMNGFQGGASNFGSPSGVNPGFSSMPFFTPTQIPSFNQGGNSSFFNAPSQQQNNEKPQEAGPPPFNLEDFFKNGFFGEHGYGRGGFGGGYFPMLGNNFGWGSGGFGGGNFGGGNNFGWGQSPAIEPSSNDQMDLLKLLKGLFSS